MNLLFLPLFLSSLARAPGATDGRHHQQANVCAAPTDQTDRIVTRYATSDEYARVRAGDGLPQARPDQIRVLTDDSHAATCARLLTVLREVRRVSADDLIVFYKVDEYYYVVVPPPPSRCRARPNHLCIDLRWGAMYIFDPDFEAVVSVAV
jgi:hypothetical protein